MISADRLNEGSSHREVALVTATFPWCSGVFPLHTPRSGLGSRNPASPPPSGLVCDCYKRDECGSPGKHPRTMDGLRGASQDPLQIERWWDTWPDANIAAVIADRYCVVDIDSKEAHEEIGRRNRAMPTTAFQRTGRGGHAIYLADEIVRSSPTDIEKVDLRGSGSYIVVAPSLHAGGKRYRWITDPSMVNAWPDWVRSCRRRTPIESGIQPGEPIPEHCRNDTLIRLAGAMRRWGCDEEIILSALASYNTKLCQPPLGGQEVAVIAKSACRYRPNNLGYWFRTVE